MQRKSLYVPVLRSHRAEQQAIRGLRTDIRQVVAPLIEVSSETAIRLADASAHKVAKHVHELAGACGPGELYLDLGPLLDRPDFTPIALELERRLLALHSETQLVIRLKDLNQPEKFHQFQELFRRNGLGFRVTPTDYVDATLASIRTYLRCLGLVFQMSTCSLTARWLRRGRLCAGPQRD